MALLPTSKRVFCQIPEGAIVLWFQIVLSELMCYFSLVFLDLRLETKGHCRERQKILGGRPKARQVLGEKLQVAELQVKDLGPRTPNWVANSCASILLE